MVKKEERRERRVWPWILATIAAPIAVFAGAFVVVALLIALLTGSDHPGVRSGNVAVIPVYGVISTQGGGSLVAEGDTSSTQVVEWIKDATEDSDIVAIVVEIDSPGGSPVASDEIGTAIKRTNKTTVALIREMGASGGYWVASATDHIIANRMSLTGSIGVIGSGLELGGFLQDHNITYRRTVAGKYKDAGTPLRESTAEERALLQSTVDQIYDVFVDEIAQNRHLPKNKVRELAAGFVFLGTEAQRQGLVDELGGMDEALAYIDARENITSVPVWYGTSPRFIDVLLGRVRAAFDFSVRTPVKQSLEPQLVDRTTFII